MLRLIAYGLLTIAMLALTRWGEHAVLGFEADVLALLNFLDAPSERVLAGAAQVLAVVVGVGVLIVPIVLKRYRLLGYLIVANIASAALVGVALAWLEDGQPQHVSNHLASRAGLELGGVVTPSGLAGFAASFVILAPFVSQRWRRAGAVMIATFALLRIALSVQLPAEIFFALALGGAVGAAVLLAFGRPDQHATNAAIIASLAAAALPVVALEAVQSDSRGSRAYVATRTDGTRLYCKVLSPEERSADVLYRAFRSLRLKNVGDERPFWSLRRNVEHEALASLQARDVGVRTPRMRTISEVGTDSMLVAYDLVDGQSLDQIDPDQPVDDALLRSIWEQVAILRAHRIAHRDLRRGERGGRRRGHAVVRRLRVQRCRGRRLAPRWRRRATARRARGRCRRRARGRRCTRRPRTRRRAHVVAPAPGERVERHDAGRAAAAEGAAPGVARRPSRSGATSTNPSSCRSLA